MAGLGVAIPLLPPRHRTGGLTSWGGARGWALTSRRVCTDINECEDGWTPLHASARSRNTRVASGVSAPTRTQRGTAGPVWVRPRPLCQSGVSVPARGCLWHPPRVSVPTGCGLYCRCLCPQGLSVPTGELSVPTRGCLCPPGGVCARRGCLCPPGGVCARQGVSVPAREVSLPAGRVCAAAGGVCARQGRVCARRACLAPAGGVAHTRGDCRSSSALLSPTATSSDWVGAGPQVGA